MKVQYALAASALALGIAVSAAPAKAATVTDFVTFDIKDAYGQFGVVGYSSSAEAIGSFDITFDPTKLYPASGIGSQSVSGAVTFLSLTVTNPLLSVPPLPFSPSDIQYFKYTVAHSRYLAILRRRRLLLTTLTSPLASMGSAA